MATRKTEYDNAYRRTNYDTVTFRIKKGGLAEYQRAAADLGLGQAEMYRLAVEEFIANHAGGDFLPVVKPAPITSSPAEKLSSQEKTLLVEFNKLPTDVRKALLKTIKAINVNQSDATENHDTD